VQASSASGEALRLAAFTAVGTPFELMDATVRGARCRVFRHAPRCLSQLYVAAQAHAARTFTVADGVRLSYAQVLAHAAALAADLAAHGVGRGTHVALAMRNRPEWLVAFIASSALGAVPVLVNSRGTAPEIAASLRYAACEHVIADGPRAQLIAAGGAAGLAGVLVGGRQPPGSTWRRYEDIVAGPAGALPAVQCAPEDPAVIMFTSGTTGAPRGAVLSHVGMLTALMANQLSVALLAAQIAARLGIDMAALARSAPQPCTLLVFPLFHTGGCLSVFLANLARGGKLAFLPRWQAADALQLVQEERVTSLPAVPTMLWDLLQSPQLQQFDTSSLANLGTGGQGMPANLLQVIHATFPTAILGTGYGMTETNGMVSLTLGEEYLAYPDSAGRPLPTAQIRIVDEAGREVRAGDSGEVCIRSAQNMNGYWDSPAADAERVRDGWLHSGDIGRIDGQGFLYIVGRKTDMVICGGENIYCAEVERVLLQHPQVLEAATFGVPDARLGEQLVAAIVPRGAARLDAAALREFCGTRLAAYKLPHAWHFVGPLERNALGKVMKAQLRARLYGG
jgi:long-chain acyl-CoA synthetase